MLSKQFTHARGLRAISAIGLLLLGVAASAAPERTLVDLAREGKRENVLAAIASPDADVNVKAADGSTALMWAAHNADPELVKALLKRGARANVTNNFGATALSEAIMQGEMDMFLALLDAGADIESPNLDNQTALMLAISGNQQNMARELIKRGANVKAMETFRDQTALMWAAGAGQPEIVDLLLENGAASQVNLRASFDDWERQQTSEPRAQYGSRQTGGLTALLFATRSGCLKCAESLVAAGADVNRPNPDGVTPLINALDGSKFDIAMFLLDKGADPNVWDKHGRTPIYVAVDRNSGGGGGFGGFGGGGRGGGPGGAGGRGGGPGGPAGAGGRAGGPGARGGGNPGAAPGAIGAPGGPGGPPGGFGGGGFGGGGFGGAGGPGGAQRGPTVTAMQVINRLIDMGVDVNHQLTQKRPYGQGRQRFQDYDMRDGVGPLFLAVLQNDPEAAEVLLKHGAEVDLPNVFKMTPFMIAAGMRASGRNTLCGGGADPSRTGRMMTMLLDAGADINAQVSGSHNHSGTIMAYVTGCDQEGRTALMNAAWNGSEAMARDLLERGADPKLRDAANKSALDLAHLPPPAVEGMADADKERLQKGRAAVAALLEAAMGKAGGA